MATRSRSSAASTARAGLGAHPARAHPARRPRDPWLRHAATLGSRRRRLGDGLGDSCVARRTAADRPRHGDVGSASSPATASAATSSRVRPPSIRSRVDATLGSARRAARRGRSSPLPRRLIREPGVLQPEHQLAAQLTLAARQLRVGDAVRGDRRPSSSRHDPSTSGDLARARSRRRPRTCRRRRSCVVERVDRVRQAALLRISWNSRRAHAAAEGVVEHPEREPALVGRAASAGHAEHEVGLLGRPRRAPRPARAGAPAGPARRRRGDRGAAPVEPGRERLATSRDHRGVLQRCRRRRPPWRRAGSGAGRSRRSRSRVMRRDRLAAMPITGRPSGRVAEQRLGEQVVHGVARGRRRAWRSPRGSRPRSASTSGGAMTAPSTTSQTTSTASGRSRVEDVRVVAGVLLAR